MLKRKIPFSPPDITDEEIEEVVDALKSGWITTGPKTKKFENNINSYIHSSRVACFGSATAAMEMTLRLLDIGPGDEVITAAYTYTASASVIVHVGASLVMVDTAPGSFHLDYQALADAITPKTKAIIPVDIGGKMCNYDKIVEIVEAKRNLFTPNNDLQKAIGRIAIIADAAHSFGADYKGLKNGQWADFTCFSFHAVKNLTTAEGGACAWKDIDGMVNNDIYHQFMLLSMHGQSKDALAKTNPGQWEYDIIAPYYKCNMTDLQAALGLSQLRRYDEILKRRREIISLYEDLLKDFNGKAMRHYGDDFSSSGHIFMYRLLGRDEAFRNRVITRMAEKGVTTNVHFKPLPMHTAYKNLGFDIKDFPNSYDMYKNEITFPTYTTISDDDIHFVVETFKETIRELEEEDQR